MWGRLWLALITVRRWLKRSAAHEGFSSPHIHRHHYDQITISMEFLNSSPFEQSPNRMHFITATTSAQRRLITRWDLLIFITTFTVRIDMFLYTSPDRKYVQHVIAPNCNGNEAVTERARSGKLDNKESIEIYSISFDSLWHAETQRTTHRALAASIVVTLKTEKHLQFSLTFERNGLRRK